MPITGGYEGRLLQVIVHAADIPEREGARMLLEHLSFPAGRLRLIWADAGYSGEDFSKWIEQRHGAESKS
jgi:putative transposase